MKYLSYTSVYTGYCIKCKFTGTVGAAVYNREVIGKQKPRFRFWFSYPYDTGLLGPFTNHAAGQIFPEAYDLLVRYLGICKDCAPRCEPCGSMLPMVIPTEELISFLEHSSCTSCAAGALASFKPPKPNRAELMAFRKRMSLRQGG
jgi:hypothetical protein